MGFLPESRVIPRVEDVEGERKRKGDKRERKEARG